MDLKQIEYFVRVAEVGSFSGAARLLGIAQPALSRQIRQLEVELRQTLFVRDGRGAKPTEAGELLLAHGRAILHRLETAREELAGARGRLAGHVAIGLPPSVARVVTVPLTRAFRIALPEATLSIGEGLSSALLEGLRQGRFDLAVLYDAQPAPEIELTDLFEEELWLIEGRLKRASPRRGPVPLSELAGTPLIIPSRPNAIRLRVERALAELGARPKVALEIDGVAAILDLVAEGFGAAVLPPYALAGQRVPRRFTLRRFSPALGHRIGLATSALRPLTRTQQETQRMLAEVIRRELAAAAKR
ncbi:MAG: LysR substrate-binding domain-containing protein [Casimicrobiaceae bacterium]|nr:LysR substrate-binding domain-containing protein [Casimicrobiaceae bacterium]MCX8097975.1 LysR substrate-binding domain-containing protein [Casimicrobiaceae bacterium]MDW8312665.1 LysR substrate-binding domain-containing protein [Burkholderiales bacterium]